MRSCLPIVRRFWLFLGLGIMAGSPGIAWAQGQLGRADELKAAFKETQARRGKLMTGEEQPGKADKNVAEAAANYYLYRLTHVTESPLDVHKEFAKAVDIAMEARHDKNRPFIQGYFGPALAASMKEVLQGRDIKTNQATIMGAAMMLPTMAKLKQDNIGDLLADLVKDPATHDVVRLYALKALRETMPIGVQPDDPDLTDAKYVARLKRDVKHVEALTTYIENPVGGAGAADLAAVHFIRREAIISLAHAGAPAVLALPVKVMKKPNPDGMVAPTLLKVLAGGDVKLPLKPLPSLQEKIEAVIGLCAMKHPNMPEYDPTVATYLIGRTIVEFVDDYSKDLANIAVVGTGRKLPYIGYRTEARRLRAGLTEFAKNGNAKSTKLLEAADPILGGMTKAGTLYPRVVIAEVGELRRFVQDMQQSREKTGKVFKTLEAPVFPPK